MVNYSLRGQVEAGRGDGAKLGAPTANLALRLAEEQAMVPGLYTCIVLIDEREFTGLLYYGINSLTGADCLEVHLRDFSQVLYGKTITVATAKYLRKALFFTSREALQKQIQIDLKTVGWIA